MSKINIPLAEPSLGEKEKRAVLDVLESGWLSQGEKVEQFEKHFAALHGQENGVAVNSCTAALHLGLCGLGIGPGDEVLVPSMSFVATAASVLHAGAKPILVDIISPEIPHICPKDAERKITPATKAVTVMHYGGYRVEMGPWRDMARKHGLHIIEDAAHAPGLTGVATDSDCSAFSFFPNKNMTTSEGGMLLASDPKVLAIARNIRAHGMTATTLDRKKGHAFSYDVMGVGYNYRMDEMRAALGLAQLEKLPEWNNARRDLIAAYRKSLAQAAPSVTIPFTAEWPTAGHLMPVLLPMGTNRPTVMTALRQAGIFTSIHYPPTHLFSYYKKLYPELRLPVCEAFTSRELTLPLYPAMDTEDVARVAAELGSALA